MRRAQVLLKADADGPCWVDTQIEDAFGCHAQSVERIRQRFVLEGFEIALYGRMRTKAPTEKLLNGEQEAKLIATRLGKPPSGFAHWTLYLLADQMFALEIVPSISHETVRKTYKKRHDKTKDRVLGDPA
ncbi:MAG TPA: helix-turn-helix domain-containing protein [Planctomycetaceae bacterium]|nr:helix-turn-helix domain-containing protein [Planctomycetaceae bacterium]